MVDGQLESIWSQLHYVTRALSPVRLVLKVTLFLLLHCTGSSLVNTLPITKKNKHAVVTEAPKKYMCCFRASKFAPEGQFRLHFTGVFLCFWGVLTRLDYMGSRNRSNRSRLQVGGWANFLLSFTFRSFKGRPSSPLLCGRELAFFARFPGHRRAGHFWPFSSLP